MYEFDDMEDFEAEAPRSEGRKPQSLLEQLVRRGVVSPDMLPDQSDYPPPKREEKPSMGCSCPVHGERPAYGASVGGEGVEDDERPILSKGVVLGLGVALIVYSISRNKKPQAQVQRAPEPLDWIPGVLE